MVFSYSVTQALLHHVCLFFSPYLALYVSLLPKAILHFSLLFPVRLSTFI